jgi:hypothetical protein
VRPAGDHTRHLDHKSGLPDGYSGKVLSPRAIKKLGNISLPLILAATDLVLLLAVNPEAAQQITTTTGDASDASDDASERQPHWRSIKGPAWGRRMAARRALKQSPEERSASARKAAEARWNRARSEDQNHGFATPSETIAKPSTTE